MAGVGRGRTDRGMLLLLVVYCLVGLGCGGVYRSVAKSWCENYYTDPRYEQTRYPVHFEYDPDATTPMGINVDANGLPVDLLRIDMLVDEFENCYGKPVKRCGIRITIEPPLVTEPSEGFYCGLGDTGICTGLYQYPALIIVTPNLAALKHELVHLVAHRDHGDPMFRCE